MAPSAIVKPVDVLKNGSFGLPPCLPLVPPDQLRFDRLKERLDRGIIPGTTVTKGETSSGQATQLPLPLIDGRRP